MSTSDIIAFLPPIVVGITAIVVMMTIAVTRNHLLSAILTFTGLVVAFAVLWISKSLSPIRITTLLVLDSYSIFFLGLILLTTAAVVVLAYGYLRRYSGNHEEFYIVLLVATFGSMVMVMSEHFVSFFLGLELLTISLVVMVAYLRDNPFALEAGMKYFILASASSAFLLFGMALIYTETGTMQFREILPALAAGTDTNGVLVITGLSMMIVGIGYKLAVVPFHMWTPDVYEGAAVPVTAFVATVSKGAMFALLVRFFSFIEGYRFTSVVIVFGVIAAASMFTGNLLALLQRSVKRILAYSSISHLGYMLVAFVAGGTLGVEAVTFYLVVYIVTILGAFGIIAVLSSATGEEDSIDAYRGLFWSRPWIATVFTIVLLSLAGIPLTAGFIGKYYVMTAGAGSAYWTLLIILVINSAIGLFYYLRIVVSMMSAPTEESTALPARIPGAGGFVLACLALVILWLGIYPGPMMQFVRSVTAVFLP